MKCDHSQACADCHMPCKRVGVMKISDHHVQSPLLNINAACQTRHKWPEDELKARVELIHDRTYALRNRAIDALVELIADFENARGDSSCEDAARRDPCRGARPQRQAQFRVDFVEAENSTGFHAPQEAARILAEAIDLPRNGQLAVRSGAWAPR